MQIIQVPCQSPDRFHRVDSSHLFLATHRVAVIVANCIAQYVPVTRAKPCSIRIYLALARIGKNGRRRPTQKSCSGVQLTAIKLNCCQGTLAQPEKARSRWDHLRGQHKRSLLPSGQLAEAQRPATVMLRRIAVNASRRCSRLPEVAVIITGMDERSSSLQEPPSL